MMEETMGAHEDRQEPVSMTPILTSAAPEPASMLLLAKLGSMLVLGLGSLLLGMLPLLIGRYRLRKNSESSANLNFTKKNQVRHHHGHQPESCTVVLANGAPANGPDSGSQGLVTSLLLCFGGGVLLFTTFLHLAPEVRESVKRHQESGQLADLGSLSLAELLFCSGFFLVYFVEEAVHAALTDRGPESSETLLYRTVSVRRCSTSNNNNNNNHVKNVNNNNFKPTKSATAPTLQQPIRVWRTDSSDDAEEMDHNPRSLKVNTGPMFVLSSDEESRYHHRHHRGDYLEDRYPEPGVPKVKHNHHQHGHHQHNGNSLRSLLTVLALSFHAIFEGLAVGLEPAFSSVLYLATAIATHKLVISFCVGMELWVAGASRRAILGYLSVFAMVTPLGIGLGLGLGHFRNDSENLGATPTILQAMAAGTLLYVVFFEVLARERANDKSGLLQLAAIFIGFMLMLALQIITAHSHNHGGGHSHEGEHAHEAVDLGTHSHKVGLTNDHLHSHIGSAAIERVTDKVVDVLSTTLT